MTTTIPTFDANGLVTLTLAQIQENMRDAVAASSDLGPEVSTGAHSIVGMVLDAAAMEIENCYRLIDDVWAGMDPDQAEGVQQDAVNRLRGAVRKAARYSTATVTCSGVAATVIPAGSIVAIPSGGARWITDADATIGGGGTVDVDITAEDSGPVEAAAGSITEIVTAVSGWTGVTNAADAELGEDVESDTAFRNRSEQTSTGTTIEEAIYTRLSELDDVDAVVVVSNRTDAVNAYGMEPHSVWAVVYPSSADQQTIAETMWGEAGMPAGIEMNGAVTATVTDASGYTQQIKWDWATAVDVWISVVGTKDSEYPAGGDTLVEDAITDYFATVRVGADVYPAPIAAAIVDAVPGIMTLEVRMKIGSAPGAGDTSPLTVDINEYADLNATVGVSVT